VGAMTPRSMTVDVDLSPNRCPHPPRSAAPIAANLDRCSTRSEMIDLRVLGGDVAGRIQALELVTTFIPDDLWPELLRAAPDPSSG
jgi:hypothetical protein